MKEKVIKELKQLATEMGLSIRDTMIDVLYYFYLEVGYDDDTAYAILEEKSDEELFENFYEVYKDDREM